MIAFSESLIYSGKKILTETGKNYIGLKRFYKLKKFHVDIFFKSV